MAEHISELEIRNFRRFDHLRAENLGQFNLIVGDNNVGKTSFLEALLFDGDLNQWLFSLYAGLFYRGLAIRDGEMGNLDSYFHDRNVKEVALKIKDDENQVQELNFTVQLTSELSKEELDRLILKNIGRNPSKYSAVQNLSNNKDIQSLPIIGPSGTYVPYVSSDNVFGHDLIKFYSENIQRRKSLKDELIQNLSNLIPNLENIEISGSSEGDTFLLTLKDEEDARFINQYGEGTIKLLRVLLEVYICREKRIMIDELGAGIHYSRLGRFYELILDSCEKNSVQVFATTHSKECIEAFVVAIKSLHLESKARILRLADTVSGIRMYTYTFEQFESALAADSEIR
jgi:AAA15 family ATPase/GTPase